MCVIVYLVCVCVFIHLCQSGGWSFCLCSLSPVGSNSPSSLVMNQQWWKGQATVSAQRQMNIWSALSLLLCVCECVCVREIIILSPSASLLLFSHLHLSLPLFSFSHPLPSPPLWSIFFSHNTSPLPSTTLFYHLSFLSPCRTVQRQRWTGTSAVPCVTCSSPPPLWPSRTTRAKPTLRESVWCWGSRPTYPQPWPARQTQVSLTLSAWLTIWLWF